MGEKCIAEKRQELVEDKFEMKMQLEMKQMKDRLKNDFSKEVEALEEEINELRRTFDNRSANYDEGRGSRYGLSDESSDDDVERLITKQQRKLRKRISRSSRNFESDADSLYESSYAEFNRNIKTLVNRVDALESRLTPCLTPAPHYTSKRMGVHNYNTQHNPVMMQYQNISSPNLLTGFGSQQMQGPAFGSVYNSLQRPPSYNHIDEQLNQAKQWLKQRTLNLK